MSWKSVVEKRTRVKGNILVVGVDIGKRRHIAAAIFPDGESVKRFKFHNDSHGFGLFLQQIRVWKQRGGCKDVIVGLESTGHYMENLAYWLVDRGIKLVQVNPLHVKKSKETLDNSPGKTDVKDALLIADLIAQGKYLTLVLPRGICAELRQLMGLRSRLIVERTAKRNLLHAAVDRIFPEFSRVFKDLSGKTARYLLRHFPMPEEVLSLSEAELSFRLKRECNRSLRGSKVKELQEEAVSSVGIKEGLEGARRKLHDALDKLEQLMMDIWAVETRIKALVYKIDESRILLSVRGLGVMTVAILISETCGFKHYRSAECILKLAGLNLYEISSGEHKGARRITRRGRSLLRYALYLAALRQAKRGAPLHDYYARLVASGMEKVKALIAVARKLVRLLFALVRDGRYYTEQSPCRCAVASAA